MDAGSVVSGDDPGVAFFRALRVMVLLVERRIL